MAMFTNARAMIFGVRSHKSEKTGKTTWFASFSVLSGKKTGDDEKGNAVYKNDKPYHKSAVIRGKKAQEFLSNCEERSFAKLLVKQYTYSVGEGEDQEWREAVEILKAEEYVPEASESDVAVDPETAKRILKQLEKAAKTAEELPEEDEAA
jgi:nitrogen regulatory protein PII